MTKSETSHDSFPRHSARTRRFTLGEPRDFTVCAEGRRLFFLRAVSGGDPRTGLWVVELPDGAERMIVDPTSWGDEELSEEERARRERVRERALGVVAYSASDAGDVVAFGADSHLHVVDVSTGSRRVLAEAGDVFDPRLDPTGRRVAYVSARALWVIDVDGGEPRCLARDDDVNVAWGRAEHAAAEEMNRSRGFWWSPDGGSLLVARVDESPVRTWWISDPAHPDRAPRPIRYPAAGTDNAAVSLHHVQLDGARQEIVWDAAALPYLARVNWAPGHQPLVQVQSRDQRRVCTLSVDVESGKTTLLYDDQDSVWVELFDGVPCWSGDEVVRIVDDGGSRRLFVGADAVTAPEQYVRVVAGAAKGEVVLTASYDDPTQVHVLRWTRADGVEPLTSEPGVHAATSARGVVVVASAALDRAGRRHEVRSAGATRVLRSVAESPQMEPVVRLLTVGARQLRCGLVLPREHSAGDRWPVLLDPYGGPHSQRVLHARGSWLEPQWLADRGFAVLVVDGRGTPGRGPEWERSVHRNLTATLEDQVDALHAVAELEPALDLDRVAIRGWSFGGYLAAMAVLHRPDVFSAAVAGAPVVDWRLYDTHYTERYLGLPQEHPEVYARNSLLDVADTLTRPLLLIHGLADDNVVSAHTLLLSQRLTESGREHAVLPLTGVTHMAAQEVVAENLLLLQVDFLHRALAE